MDVAGSAPALAVLEVAREKKRVVVYSGPGTERITNDLCSPYSVHYTYDTWSLANTTARATVEQGGKSWYFLTADYGFGHAAGLGHRGGGQWRRVLGAARHPLGSSDFASYLLQAQASRAQVIGLANAGGDTVNAIKAASEFGLTRGGQKMAGLLLYINDIHAIGLEAAAGLTLTEAFYWDLNEQTRAWSKRYYDKLGKMPNMSQAGTYSSVMHYLKAVQAAGTDDAAAVMKQMKAMPINDFFATNGRIREDGRMVHDMYLFEVKKPSESKQPWDYYAAGHAAGRPGLHAPVEILVPAGQAGRAGLTMHTSAPSPPPSPPSSATARCCWCAAPIRRTRGAGLFRAARSSWANASRTPRASCSRNRRHRRAADGVRRGRRVRPRRRRLAAPPLHPGGRAVPLDLGRAGGRRRRQPGTLGASGRAGRAGAGPELRRGGRGAQGGGAGGLNRAASRHPRRAFPYDGRPRRSSAHPMFDAYLQRWNLAPAGAPITTPAARLLPVLHEGQPAMLKISHEQDEREGGVLMRWWDGQGGARAGA